MSEWNSVLRDECLPLTFHQTFTLWFVSTPATWLSMIALIDQLSWHHWAVGFLAKNRLTQKIQKFFSSSLLGDLLKKTLGKTVSRSLKCFLSMLFWKPFCTFTSFDFSSVQFSRSVVPDSATPWTAVRQASLSITNSRSLPKLMSIESVMPSNHFLLCHPLFLLPSIFPNIRVFSNESALHIRWPKYWSFSFSFSSSNEYSGLISFRMDWLDLLAVQGTLKNLLQHHSSKASILRRSAFFIVQLSHPYMTTGKTIALSRWTFVGKVMFLLFNMLSRVVTFLPRSKHLLISRL